MYTLTDEPSNPLGLYCVKAGDTLAAVSEAAGVTPAAVIAENALRTFPPAGALLCLPPAAGEVYTVRAEDTLPSLCRRFGVREEDFIRQNGCAYVWPTQRVRLPRPR